MFEIVWNVWTAESLRHFVIPETVSAEKRSEPLSEEPSGEGLTTGVWVWMFRHWWVWMYRYFGRFFQICNHMLTFQLSSRSEIYKIFASLYRSKLKNYCVTRILDSRWSLLGWLTNFQLVSPKVTNWPNWPNLIFAIDQWFSQLVSWSIIIAILGLTNSK